MSEDWNNGIKCVDCKHFVVDKITGFHKCKVTNRSAGISKLCTHLCGGDGILFEKREE